MVITAHGHIDLKTFNWCHDTIEWWSIDYCRFYNWYPNRRNTAMNIIVPWLTYSSKFSNYSIALLFLCPNVLKWTYQWWNLYSGGQDTVTNWYLTCNTEVKRHLLQEDSLNDKRSKLLNRPFFILINKE